MCIRDRLNPVAAKIVRNPCALSLETTQGLGVPSSVTEDKITVSQRFSKAAAFFSISFIFPILPLTVHNHIVF